MNDAAFIEVSAWLTQAGLGGVAEPEILAGFCERCAAAGLPVGRALLFLDTLHPVHEGSVFRWGFGPNEPAVLDYGRTSQDALAAAGFDPGDVEAAERGYIDDVIMPSTTRPRIARALAMLRGKTVEMPGRKHDNLPV